MYCQSKMYSFFSSKSTTIILGVLLFCILPFFLLFFYCHPSGDDFSYAMLGTKQPLLPALADEYNLWNGRFTSNVFVLKSPLIYRVNWLVSYRFSMLAIFLFSICTLYFFFTYFFKNVISKKQILAISFFFMLLDLFQMPILSEGTYWYTGVVTYQVANSIMLFYLIGLHKFLNLTNGLSKIGLFVILFILLILLSGFNEVIMLLLLVFHLVVGIHFFVKKNKNTSWISGLLLASIIGFSIVYFAPGNKVREAYFIGESHRFYHSFTSTLLQTLRFGFEWLSSGVILLVSLIYIPISKNLSKHVDLFKNNFFINKWVSLVALVSVLFISIFPAYWSTGIMGQHRTVNTAYFYFLFLWFINLTIWTNKSLFFQKLEVKKSMMNYCLVISLVLMCGTGNTFNAWKDLISSQASNFDTELNQRYQRLNSFSKSADEIQTLPKLKSHPVSLFIYDITNDPKYFPNTCYKSYWNLKSYIIGK